MAERMVFNGIRNRIAADRTAQSGRVLSVYNRGWKGGKLSAWRDEKGAVVWETEFRGTLVR